jgi:hypothetical protein
VGGRLGGGRLGPRGDHGGDADSEDEGGRERREVPAPAVLPPELPEVGLAFRWLRQSGWKDPGLKTAKLRVNGLFC